MAIGNWKAPGATTRRSQIIASCTPAPIAGPLIAPITGTGTASMALFSAIALSGKSAANTSPERSAPAQNTVPWPVSTTARTSSAAAFSTASRRVSTSSELSALRRSGRCSSMVVTSPTRLIPIMEPSLLAG